MAGGANAGEFRASPVAVLELFTSQGCSSCPPADAIVEEFNGREDIVALAYHVDYWDYIGWPDSFADSSYSDLQRAYAASWGKNRIYTPQLVINGKIGVVGSRRRDVEQAVEDASLSVKLDLDYYDGMLEVSIAGNSDLPESTVWVVTYRHQAEVEIGRGENRGRTISYVQIVTGRQALGMWEPESGAHIKLPLRDILPEGSDGIALIVQQDNDGLPGPIIGAASVQF